MPTLKNAVFHVTEPGTQLPIFHALDYLGGLEVEGPTVVKIHYARRALLAAHAAFEDARKEFVKRHGSPNEDGNLAVSPENWEAFVGDYAALLEHEFEVAEAFTLDDIKGLKTKEVELRKLGDLFQWPEPKAKPDIEPASKVA